MQRLKSTELLFPLFAAALFCGGCGGEAADAIEDTIPASGEQTPAGEVEALETVMTVEFQPTPAAQGQIHGTLQILAQGVEQPQPVHLQARLEGLSPGPHAWHIHRGVCGQGGPVVVPFTVTQDQPGIAEPLIAGLDGVAEQTVFLPPGTLLRHELMGGGYSVHVHQGSGVDHGPTIACADF